MEKERSWVVRFDDGWAHLPGHFFLAESLISWDGLYLPRQVQLACDVKEALSRGRHGLFLFTFPAIVIVLLAFLAFFFLILSCLVIIHLFLVHPFYCNRRRVASFFHHLLIRAALRQPYSTNTELSGPNDAAVGTVRWPVAVWNVRLRLVPALPPLWAARCASRRVRMRSHLQLLSMHFCLTWDLLGRQSHRGTAHKLLSSCRIRHATARGE